MSNARGAVSAVGPQPEDARNRLLAAALRLFAEQGYSRTSTRELAEAARVNIASISYYFGDKAGLYRAAFFEPMGLQAPGEKAKPELPRSLQGMLRLLYASFLEPLKLGDSARLCMKLRFREMLEPTGLWDEEVARDIRPVHDMLVACLLSHFGLSEPDDDVLRLALMLAGLGVHLHVGRDIIDQLAPGLNQRVDAVDVWADRLVLFGTAMVDAEVRRRSGAAVAAGRGRDSCGAVAQRIKKAILPQARRKSGNA